MIVDSDAGRLYMHGSVDGVSQIVALAAADGRLLMTYNTTGTFAVDPVHGRLYVDRGISGLEVLDSQTGDLQALIALHGIRDNVPKINPAPQADVATGNVLFFRDNVMLVIDPARGILDTVAFEVARSSCDVPAGVSPINWTAYDHVRRLLYLKFTTYTCTPSFGETLVSYDLNTGAEIARHGIELSAATAGNGYLYGSGQLRIPYGGSVTAYRWVWRDGRPWLVSEDWVDWGPLFVDSARGSLYEANSGFRVLDAETLDLSMNLPKPVEGTLVGHDVKTDQLYFLLGGRLQMWPASALLPPTPEPLQISAPPAQPVGRLVVSPSWSQDKSLFGLWDYGLGGCGFSEGQGGLIYLSTDGGAWGHPRGGLRGSCERVSALAVSPGHARDRTLFAGVIGMGVLKSTDGGRLWLPSNAGLSRLYIWQIVLSPNFEQDLTAFLRAGRGRGMLYRSVDGGATWRPLDLDVNWIDMSPEFDQDRTLMAVGFDDSGVLLSKDGGDTWERVGEPPEGVRFSALSIAPLFSQWQVVFAFGNGVVYHSVDGGRSWNAVLELEPGFNTVPPQLVYGPATEKGRTLFLLATTTDSSVDPPQMQGSMYYSEDAINWRALALPSDVVPTALAISPDFAQDGLLFVGTADGQVLSLDAGTLAAR